MHSDRAQILSLSAREEEEDHMSVSDPSNVSRMSHRPSLNASSFAAHSLDDSFQSESKPAAAQGPTDLLIAARTNPRRSITKTTPRSPLHEDHADWMDLLPSEKPQNLQVRGSIRTSGHSDEESRFSVADPSVEASSNTFEPVKEESVLNGDLSDAIGGAMQTREFDRRRFTFLAGRTPFVVKFES
jgi:hypothetical protein